MAGMESDKNQKVFSMPHKTQAVLDEATLALRTTKDWGDTEAENVGRKWNHHVELSWEVSVSKGKSRMAARAYCYAEDRFIKYIQWIEA